MYISQDLALGYEVSWCAAPTQHTVPRKIWPAKIDCPHDLTSISVNKNNLTLWGGGGLVNLPVKVPRRTIEGFFRINFEFCPKEESANFPVFTLIKKLYVIFTIDSHILISRVKKNTYTKIAVLTRAKKVPFYVT
jgi:hypothetical protein